MLVHACVYNSRYTAETTTAASAGTTRVAALFVLASRTICDGFNSADATLVAEAAGVTAGRFGCGSVGHGGFVLFMSGCGSVGHGGFVLPEPVDVDAGVADGVEPVDLPVAVEAGVAFGVVSAVVPVLVFAGVAAGFALVAGVAVGMAGACVTWVDVSVVGVAGELLGVGAIGTSFCTGESLPLAGELWIDVLLSPVGAIVGLPLPL